MAVEPLPTPCGLKRTYAPVSLGGPWKRLGHPMSHRSSPAMSTPMDQGRGIGPMMTSPRPLLIGCGVVFAILGVMFFLGMIVPAVVRWVL
jgi:hypothetical protein